MIPAAQPLAEGLGVFLRAGGVAAGGKTDSLPGWDYPILDLRTFKPGTTKWLKPLALPGGVYRPSGRGFTSTFGAILCASARSWPRPDHLVSLPAVAANFAIVNGPREHTAPAYYLTPGQWVTLGLYDQWLAAGRPAGVLLGQHDNTAGSPPGWLYAVAGATGGLAGLAIVADPSLGAAVGGAVGAAVGQPALGAAVGGALGAVSAAFQNVAGSVGGNVPGYAPGAAAPPIPAAPGQSGDLLVFAALAYLLG